MSINLDGIIVFFLIMTRMLGMLVFNPILGRNNVPTQVRAGLALFLAILLSGTVTADLPDPGLLLFAYWIGKELLVGLVAGFLLRMFLSVFTVGGELIDMQMGISMAKAFDPGSGLSVALSAQYLNIMFYLSFFATNAHLTLIQLTAQSFQVLPIGTYVVNFEMFHMIPHLFSNILILAVKLALPMVVVEIVVTFAVGIIMRIIPQINVFVISIQIKLIVGLIVLVLMVPAFFGFIENIITISTENLVDIWSNMAVT